MKNGSSPEDTNTHTADQDMKKKNLLINYIELNKQYANKDENSIEWMDANFAPVVGKVVDVHGRTKKECDN